MDLEKLRKALSFLSSVGINLVISLSIWPFCVIVVIAVKQFYLVSRTITDNRAIKTPYLDGFIRL